MPRTVPAEKPNETTGFDLLAWVEMLRSGGATKKQAETQVKVMSQIVNQGASTRADLDQAKSTLRSDMKQLGYELRSEMKDMKNEIQVELRDFKVDIIRWMFTLFIAQIGIIAALLKFMN